MKRDTILYIIIQENTIRKKSSKHLYFTNILLFTFILCNKNLLYI